MCKTVRRWQTVHCRSTLCNKLGIYLSRKCLSWVVTSDEEVHTVAQIGRGHVAQGRWKGGVQWVLMLLGAVFEERRVHRVPAGEGLGMPSTLLQGVGCIWPNPNQIRFQPRLCAGLACLAYMSHRFVHARQVPYITPISLEQWWIPRGSATLQAEMEGSLGSRNLRKKKASKMKLGIIRKQDRIQTLLLNM